MLNRQFKLTPRFLSAAARATSNVLIRSKIDNVHIRSLSLSPELLVTRDLSYFSARFSTEDIYQSCRVEPPLQLCLILSVGILSLFEVKSDKKHVLSSVRPLPIQSARVILRGWRKSAMLSHLTRLLAKSKLTRLLSPSMHQPLGPSLRYIFKDISFSWTIPNGTYGHKNSLDSKLQINSICSIRTRSGKWNIFKSTEA